MPGLRGRSSGPSTRWASAVVSGLASRDRRGRRRRQRTSRCSPAGVFLPLWRVITLVAGNRELLTEEHVPWESLSQAAVRCPGAGLHRHLCGGRRPPGGLSGPGRHPAARRRRDHPGCPGHRRDPGAADRRPRERRPASLPESWASATFQAECLPEDKLTWIDRSQRERPSGLHGGGRHQRRASPEKGLCGHRHGRRGQRHRRGRRGHRPGKRRHPGAAPSAGALQADDAHHQDAIWPSP